MARLRSADGADRAECGPVFTGDSPSSGPPLPFPVSLVLRPAQHISNTYSLQLMFWVLCISENLRESSHNGAVLIVAPRRHCSLPGGLPPLHTKTIRALLPRSHLLTQAERSNFDAQDFHLAYLVKTSRRDRRKCSKSSRAGDWGVETHGGRGLRRSGPSAGGARHRRRSAAGAPPRRALRAGATMPRMCSCSSACWARCRCPCSTACIAEAGPGERQTVA